ncbi:MAG: iron ABC transporter, partial [Gemmatimonadetes bacterium]|nr:iron ABC transporter [Gemmatimonadota bacterium]
TAFHYMLMGLVSVTTVGSFESVGAILVVAMIIVPAATAYLLSENLARMIGLAVLLGALSSVLGYEIASHLDCSIAGAMASVAGLLFSLALLFSPRQGIVARALSRRGLRRQVAEEDVLLWAARQREIVSLEGFTMHELRETHPDEIDRLARALARLIRRGLLAARGEGYELTANGREQGVALLRRHRLYESFLGDKLGYDTDHLHDPADRVEHYISPDDTTEIERVTEYPERDPQGRPIPPSRPEKEKDREEEKESS